MAKVIPFPRAACRLRSGPAANDVQPAPVLASPQAKPSSLVALLRSLPATQSLFEAMTQEVIDEIEERLESVGLPAGSILFNEGDKAPDAFVLASGRVGASTGCGGKQRTTGTITAGQWIGETALIADIPRAMTAIALEDCHLVRVPRDAAEYLSETSPAATRFLLRLLAPQLHQPASVSAQRPAVERIALVPLGPLHHVSTTVAQLSEQVDGVLIRSAEQDDAHCTASSRGAKVRVYVADNHRSSWTRHCISQCSRVVFVAPVGGSVTAHDSIAFAAQLHREMNLVLVNGANAVLPKGGTAWLGHFAASNIHHIREGHEADYERVARLLSRTSICVVLSGGGARALAHIGAIKALEENGIPIDAVGGTSMGALIAALVARGFTADAIAERMRGYLIDNNPIRDYTVPVVSLVRGRKMTNIFRHACENIQIENLWRTFFCVSADLASGSSVVHRSGPLWRALRASTAIPGIFPPVMSEGQVLVDGAIIDNLPTTQMRSLQLGPVLGIDVSANSNIMAADVAVEEKSCLWLLRHGRRQVPSIARILMSAAAVNSGSQLATSRRAADFLIQPELDGIQMLSFKAFDRAVEAGYRATLAAMPRLSLLNRRPRKPLLAVA